MFFRKSRKIRKVFILGVWAGLAGHFYCEYYWKNSPRAPYNYSDSLWTSNFSLSISEKLQTSHLQDLGIFEQVHDSQNQQYLLFETPGYFKYFKTNSEPFSQKHTLGNQNVEDSHVWNLWERPAPEHPEDPFNKFLEILNTGSISSRKHEMELW